jgi:predicted transcriptional regulator
MKELTRAEEQVMFILWKIRRGFVKDILDRMDEPRPAYNTVSTIVRILERKNFVGHKAYGKSHEYYPAISKKEYTRKYLKGFVRDYFSNSYASLASFFTSEEKLSLTEMEEIRKILDEGIRKQKQ